MSDDFGIFLLGMMAGTIVVLLILAFSMGPLVLKSEVGDFVCASHRLGEYHDMEILDNKIISVNCGNTPLTTINRRLD